MVRKLRAASDMEVDTTAEVPASRTVFIDTSLDTHLAMVLSDLDTVTDLKRKIEREHTLCFNNIGDIVVHALKVKRKGHLYHLSDSMFVKDAFDGSSKNWFISVDASMVEKKHDDKQTVDNCDSRNLLTCYGVLNNSSANGFDLALDVSPEHGTSEPNEGREVLQKHVEHQSDASKHDVIEKHDKFGEQASQSDHVVQRKRKFEDEVGNRHLQEENIDTGEDISKREIMSQHAVGGKEKSENAALDGLTSKPAHDDHPVTNNSREEKRKRQKKSKGKLDQVAAGPYSGRDVLQEGYVVTAGVDHKGSGGQPDTTSVPGKAENEIKHSDTNRETGECVPTAEDVGHGGDAPGEEAASVATKMINPKDHDPVEMESNPPVVTEKHDDLPMEMGVSGQENDIGINQAETAEEQGALSNNKDSPEMQLKKHVNVPTDIKVSGQVNVASGPTERADEQGALSKRDGSLKIQLNKHVHLPFDTGFSGQENVGSIQAERAEDQGALSKKKSSLKKRSKKNDNLPLDIGISGQDNSGSGRTGREEEQGALSKNKVSLKTMSEKHDNLPADIGVFAQENIVNDQPERAEEQEALSKRKVSRKMRAKKHDDPPLDNGVSGPENVESARANIAEEQGASSKSKGSLKINSKKHDNIPMDVGVSVQENIVSDQAERSEDRGALSKRKSSRKMWSKKHDDPPIDIGVSGQERTQSAEAEIAEEQAASSKREDSLKLQPSKLDSRRCDKAEVQSEDVNATNDLVGENGTVVPTDASKKRKRAKKTKGLVENIVTPSVRDIEGSEINISVEPLGAKYGEPPSNRAQKEESNLSQTNGKEELRSNAESTFLAEENGNVTGNEAKNMQQTMENQQDAEKVEEQTGKKTKKKLKSSVPDLQSEDGSVVHQISTSRADNKSQVVASSNTKRKAKLKKTAVKDRLNEEKMESESVGVPKEPVPAQPAQSNSILAKSTNAQSKSLDHKYKESAGEADVSDNPPNSASADKAHKETEISGSGNRGNLEKSLPVTSSGVLVDKKIGANKATKTPKAKNTESHDIHSDRISSDFQSSMRSNKKQGVECKPPARKSSTTPLQGSLSKDKPDESAVQPRKKLQKASRNEAKVPPSDVSDELNSTPKETKMQNDVNVYETNIHSEKNAGLASVPNSHMESSGNVISKDVATRNEAKAPPTDAPDKLLNSTPKEIKTQNKKNTGLASVSNSHMESPRNVTGKDVASNKHQPGVDSFHAANANAKAAKNGNGKKPVAKAGRIFKDDDSGESSEDEAGSDGSDAGTRTPSDYSQSSDYSDGESNANFNSQRKGSYTSERTKSGSRSTIKSRSSSAKKMTFDSILKSSSSYKKAKLTASQLQLEDESQPDEFVPDSLPIE